MKTNKKQTLTEYEDNLQTAIYNINFVFNRLHLMDPAKPKLSSHEWFEMASASFDAKTALYDIIYKEQK